MNPIPFNLERALAGDSLCWRNAEQIEIDEFYVIPKWSRPHEKFNVHYLMRNGGVRACDESGKDHQHEKFDLYMAPRTVTKWVVLYTSCGEICPIHRLYDTQEEAEKCLRKLSCTTRVVPIAWEE